MHRLVLGNPFAALVAPILLYVLAHKLLNKRRASPPTGSQPTGASTGELPTDACASTGEPSTGAPSSSVPPFGVYEVFLSFRGVDTRKGFADLLYTSLVDAGIHVFRDDDELRQGDSISPDLLEAIKSSSILIPIISENYASSKWCLQELVHMMECMKSSGHMVWPVFYRVEPADLRRGRGSFGEAFRYYCKRFDPANVKVWRQALAEVASLKGWESERVANGREGELIESIVRKVLIELNEAVGLDVSDNLARFDSDVEKVMELINKSSGATVCVGIHGMGGTGKTTLVKVIYNKLSGQFERHSFIADISESCQRNGIVYLQNRLISDILGRDTQVYNKDEGITLITSGFRAKKVLIILDDVDTHDQFKALAGNTDWFAPGSRILVTTRNESVLEMAGVVAKHKLKEMNDEQSLILFSRHAFRSNSPPNEFSALAPVVISIIGGLPLALEVVGSYLCGQPPKIWRETIEKMQNMPHTEVRDKLMISYYALEEDQRQMFLDIACFLIGSETRVASYMWDACGFFARLGIEVLRSMSLIIIGDNYEFGMHSQLRDLGRDIVRAESYHEPHKRSRLWVYEEAMEVLEREKGSEMIQAVCLEKGNSTGFADEDDCDYQGSRTFTPEQFKRSPKLRFLGMSDVSLSGDFKGLFSELRWLKWGNCPSDFKATNLQAEELVILDLSGSPISDDWQGWRSMMMAKELKVLNLTGCRSLKSTFYLSAFKRLEILILIDCSELEGIDPRIGDMENLVSLDLRGCLRLTELPPQMAKLERLEELHLDETAIKEIPSFISSLKKLKTLSAKYCKFLLGLPDSIGHLGCCGFHGLREISNAIGKLELLTRLDLSWPRITELPEGSSGYR
ncbi:disease resistance protein L6-like [Rhodamnia argentea]|uniref:Disease resistance protein L6-like n=1 Tax=Rhodamnia argentea TaxID=178133 RepID=A0ABM3GYC6_9MYRT|nr:disease resistance protein L6-like [Rhodamnia argentea]